LSEGSQLDLSPIIFRDPAYMLPAKLTFTATADILIV